MTDRDGADLAGRKAEFADRLRTETQKVFADAAQALRAGVAEEIASAIEGSVCEPGEQCDLRFCPDCTRWRQCQADAATARRIGGASCA